MSFRTAVERDLGVSALRPGLKALRREDKRKIEPEDTRRVSGSIDLDAEMLGQCPQANRWDFGIAYEHIGNAGEVVYWVETHTGSTSEVGTVLRKRAWLGAWLNGRALGSLRSEFVWVFSGADRILRNSPQARRLAQADLPTCVRLVIRNQYQPLRRAARR